MAALLVWDEEAPTARVSHRIENHFAVRHRGDAPRHAPTIASKQTEDFEPSPFNQRGGLGRVHQLFGADLPRVVASLNDALAA